MQQPVRAWVHDGVRQTAYVRAGAGPVVILLTPASLREELIVWLFEELAKSVRVIWPMIEEAKEMAEAMPGFLDALGIGRVGLVGIDECGAVALQFARTDPERVGRIAALATATLTADQLADLCGFLHSCDDCQREFPLP